MTPLILLPGMMCDARLFGPQINALSCRWPLMTFPLVGKDSMAALAAAVLAEAPPRFALAGLSMGGILAMEVLRQAPERVERLALLDTNPLAEAAEVAGARERQVSLVLSGGLARVMQREVLPRYLADGRGKSEILDLCLEMALALGPAVFVAQSRALATRPDQTATLAAFRGPALVLTGAQDVLCPLDRHELMAALIPGARLVVVANSGHLPTLECPAKTTAALARWLEE